MVQHKLVVDGLRLKYSGLFEIIEFYKEVEKWKKEKGLEKELKKKEEHVSTHGRKLEWFVELWKKPEDYIKEVVRIDAIMDDVKEVSLVKGGAKKTLNKGEVLIVFDAFIETDLEARWQQRPVYWFLRAIYDKIFWKVWTNKFEDELVANTYSLHKRLNGFFNCYKY